MTTRVLIIGGYGNFGRFIATKLASEADIQLILAGRRLEKAQALAMQLQAVNKPEAEYLDIRAGLASALKEIRPQVVIHTSGPFQGQGYEVAQACIAEGCHYLDLADARAFVCGIDQLNSVAEKAEVLVLSGVSSVPTLTSAIIDHYLPEFSKLESVDYGIATAQKTNQGLATTQAVLTYAGKPFTTLQNGEMRSVWGWLGLRFRRCWGLGNRALGYCDIPDLELFPKRYPDLKNVRFQAGLELTVQHLMLVGLALLVRMRILKSLRPLAGTLLNLSRWFDGVGNDDSGFFMELGGTAVDGQYKTKVFEIVARKGDGLYIPCIPSIVMAKKLARREVNERGAKACMGLVSLDEYLGELDGLNIEWRVVDR